MNLFHSRIPQIPNIIDLLQSQSRNCSSAFWHSSVKVVIVNIIRITPWMCPVELCLCEPLPAGSWAVHMCTPIGCWWYHECESCWHESGMCTVWGIGLVWERLLGRMCMVFVYIDLVSHLPPKEIHIIFSESVISMTGSEYRHTHNGPLPLHCSRGESVNTPL